MGKHLAILFILTACIAQPCVSKCCERLWMQHGSYCYRIIGTPANWQDAGTGCRNYGAELVSIHSEEENIFVYDLWRMQNRSPNTGFWIGLNDISYENTFFWSDGTTVDYLRWAPGEPNNYRDQDCIQPILHSKQWDDRSCGDWLAYACKKPLE
ncbi:alpha-N-acetylgalactosamine-specific lectin-like [Diadema antillarum]